MLGVAMGSHRVRSLMRANGAALSGRLLKQCGLSGRMSREGNCWGNVFVKAILFEPEDVASLAKNYVNHIEAMSDVFDHIIGFHNSMQLHSKRGNLQPNAFECESAIQLSTDMS